MGMSIAREDFEAAANGREKMDWRRFGVDFEAQIPKIKRRSGRHALGPRRILQIGAG